MRDTSLRFMYSLSHLEDKLFYFLLAARVWHYLKNHVASLKLLYLQIGGFT
jgi:hypothetical protein